MCRLRNIAMRDYQESVTTGQPDGRTETDAGQSDPYVPLCFAGDTIKYNNAKRSIPAHPTFVNDNHCDLHVRTVTSKSIGFTMVNMSAKLNEVAHNSFVCIWFTAYFQTCPL